MMRSTTLQIAFRNFTRNGRRFLLLGLAVGAGFFFVCTVQSLVAGLSSQINIRGARFYGGHVIIRSDDEQSGITQAREDALIRSAIARIGILPSVVSYRTHFGNYWGVDGTVFFNGESVNLRRVIGFDWSSEGGKIRELTFIAGNPDAMTGSDGVLISEVTARRLGASVGDQIILQVIRQGGAINTISLWVKAIFREASIFGYYTAYMDRRALDEALGLDPQHAATVGIYLRDFRSADWVASRLTRALGPGFVVTPVISLMPEIQTMIEALTLVSYAILALLSVVIAVGILNMYRVIIYERTREIGTMRAIGVQRPQVQNIVLCEAFLLAVCGIAAGLVLSTVGLFAISQIPLSGAAGFDIFLDRGHLTWVLYPDVVGLDAVLIAVITVLGALSPARAAQAIDPVVAMRAE
ncbi:MAG: FtsX-like permease family protein [Spirochaetia bacterium]|jgi:putative ABC transport system permease protein